MTKTPPRTRLRATIATIGGLALAASLVAATPAAAASPTACRVKDLDTGVTKASLQKAHDAAKKGHRLTVRGVCAGPTTIRKSLAISGIRTKSSGTPILDGKLSGSVVTVKRGVKVTMKSLAIRYGATDWAGGGIYNEGRLVLRDVVVRANTADWGGGVASINGGSLTLNGSSSIRGNSAEWSGGVASTGTFVMNGSSAIRANSASVGGGGVSNERGTLTMNGSSSIEGNTAANSGGGVANYGALVMNDSSSIEGNTAQVAGGVQNDGTLVMKDSSSIRQNTAANWIAGVDNRGTLRMRGSAAITANVTAGPGGGVYNHDGSTLDGVRCPMPGAKANVRNNTPDDCYPDPLLQ
jgi:hypothetical protein